MIRYVHWWKLGFKSKHKAIFNFSEQMIKMLIVVVACFSICWFPHEVYWVLKLPFPQLNTFSADPYIFTVFHMLALSHACFNPIICCWMNSSVRHGFMCTFGKWKYNIFYETLIVKYKCSFIIALKISYIPFV